MSIHARRSLLLLFAAPVALTAQAGAARVDRAEHREFAIR
jgi:hypothetical protein